MSTEQPTALLPTKPCENCGVAFERRPGEGRWEARRFCGRACAGMAIRQNVPPRPCEYCNALMYANEPGRQRTSRREFARKRFCSIRCMARAREGSGTTGRHTGACSDCGEWSERLFNGKRGQWVCRRCYRRWDWHHNADRRKKAAERYFGSLGLREAAIERDARRCQRCGEGEGLHVHHVDGDRAHNWLANLLTLCRPCHVQIHREMRQCAR